jgi:XTP/dITP diphosphohydrolase
MPDWVAATSNTGKLAEIQAIFAGTGVRLIAQGEFAIDAPDETASTFVENALLKARHASGIAGLPALADDSGLVVPFLNGSPGVRSARFAGPQCRDEDNVVRLLGLLDGVSPAERAAEFHCVVVLLRDPLDAAPIIGTGRWPGHIAPEPRGTGGFGYDPVFIDVRSGMTAAELTAEAKNRISHRALALAALRVQLAEGPETGRLPHRAYAQGQTADQN